MAQFELLMPKLGESIEEATITKWFVKVGDKIEDDDVLLEIATDKVDSEIPSPVSGTVVKIHYEQDQTVPVGTIIAVIDTSGGDVVADEKPGMPSEDVKDKEETVEVKRPISDMTEARDSVGVIPSQEVEKTGGSGRFYSPLVLTIAREEGVSMEELEAIQGSGRNGRVQKKDIVDYLKARTSPAAKPVSGPAVSRPAGPATAPEKPKVSASVSAEDEIIEMDRMRKLIADHMIMSKQTSAHVTNMLEADVTDIVLWRNRVKDDFQKREGEKITYLPVFMEAIIQALKDFPMINASVDGDKIILKKDINLGIAVALPSGNLIVPVIKRADSLNLLGLTKALNKMADAARNNKLNPDDIQGGTFTISNFGTFRNVMGTPIINQPQVAILAIGTVEKKPTVIETSTGDVIGIRHKMFLSLTYDHRIIDGAYGGAFLRKLADYLENFDGDKVI
ncbi:MAG: diapophytoene dehydrogenase [Bacteroides sp. SM23_62]|nr:MAG: diapophytoene dehydrogenase [Bacteroides sp. SM23_62]